MRLGGPVYHLAGSVELEIRKAQGLDYQIRRLQSIKGLKSRLLATEELLRKYPKNPKPHYFTFLNMSLPKMEIYRRRLLTFGARTI